MEFKTIDSKKIRRVLVVTVYISKVIFPLLEMASGKRVVLVTGGTSLNLVNGSNSDIYRQHRPRS